MVLFGVGFGCGGKGLGVEGWGVWGELGVVYVGKGGASRGLGEVVGVGGVEPRGWGEVVGVGVGVVVGGLGVRGSVRDGRGGASGRNFDF